jgi:hypothetical protein
MNWSPDAGHVVELLIAAVTFWGITWGFHREDREANKAMAKEREEKQDQRHLENQQALAKINTTLEWNPPHAHGEDDNDGPSVPLMSGCIRYGPRKRS